MRKYLFGLIWLFLCPSARGQTLSNSGIYTQPPLITLQVGGGYSLSGGDWAQRFPYYTSMQLGATYQPVSNWMLGFEYEPLLGSAVNTEGIFDGINGDSGDLIDMFGFPAVVRAYQRGYNLRLWMGRAHDFKEKGTATWSWYGQLGLGHSQHYIRYQFDEGQLPQLSGEYLAGYDRLSSGLQVSQRLGLQYYNNEAISFQLAFTAHQAFTQSLRPWNYASNSADQGTKTDLAFGLHGAIIIPIKLTGLKVEKEPAYFE
jgi:hypothetical protein